MGVAGQGEVWIQPLTAFGEIARFAGRGSLLGDASGGAYEMQFLTPPNPAIFTGKMWIKLDTVTARGNGSILNPLIAYNWQPGEWVGQVLVNVDRYSALADFGSTQRRRAAEPAWIPNRFYRIDDTAFYGVSGGSYIMLIRLEPNTNGVTVTFTVGGCLVSEAWLIKHPDQLYGQGGHL